MDDIALNLIVLVFFALLGGGIFWFVRSGQAKNEQQIRQLAAENGWKVESIQEPLAWGLRLKSANWTLVALSRSNGQSADSGSSNVSMSTVWQASVTGSTLLLGPCSSSVNLDGMGDLLTRQVLSQALGADADGLNEIQLDSEDLRQKYMFWAQQPVATEKLINPVVEKALLSWKGEPVLVKRTSEGLSIELRGVRLQKADELLALIQLGELFLEEFKSKGVSS
jgi:hypothetical protein